MSLLEMKDLTVAYHTRRGTVQAVDGVSLTLDESQHLGVIGESGCGKTTLMRALIGVLPRNGDVTGGSITFKGQNLLELSDREMRELRWSEIATIPQASMDSLDPVVRVGKQLEKILTVRGGLDRSAAKRQAVDLFELVGLDASQLTQYPHEFSGGMKQRAIIAASLALQPSLLIADEPLTALDVIVQHQVLETLAALEDELNLTIMLVTHDISVVAQLCDSVAVMYAGRIVEQAAAEPFFSAPYHPYSMGLQQAFPTLIKPKDVLVSIEGYPPDLHEPPTGCRFAERCPFVVSQCHEIDPRLEAVEPNHTAACIRAHEMPDLRSHAADSKTWQHVEAVVQPTLHPHHDGTNGRQPSADGPLVEVQAASKPYKIGGGLAGLVRGERERIVFAVNSISFSLQQGESLGIAGESGCGKSTTGKLLVKLLEPSDGSIRFNGQDVGMLTGSALKDYRRRVQLMFQNPFEALSPRFTIYRSLSEPLMIHGWTNEAERLQRVLETLDQVNLRPADAFLDKFPHQLSGGQLQRVVLARSLILRPDFLVADEPVSMLDVSVRAGILNTMRDLAKEMNLTTVYISHDLSLLQYTCDRIAIMYLGHIVEIGPTEEVINNPKHPYTRALINAVPAPDPTYPTQPLRVREGVPRPTQQIKGCPFVERCPDAMEACLTIAPPVISIADDHLTLCHLYGEHANSPSITQQEQTA